MPDLGLLYLKFKGFVAKYRYPHDLSHAPGRFDGWERPVTWPRCLFTFWCGNRTQRQRFQTTSKLSCRVQFLKRMFFLRSIIDINNKHYELRLSLQPVFSFFLSYLYLSIQPVYILILYLLSLRSISVGVSRGVSQLLNIISHQQICLYGMIITRREERGVSQYVREVSSL